MEPQQKEKKRNSISLAICGILPWCTMSLSLCSRIPSWKETNKHNKRRKQLKKIKALTPLLPVSSDAHPNSGAFFISRYSLTGLWPSGTISAPKAVSGTSRSMSLSSLSFFVLCREIIMHRRRPFRLNVYRVEDCDWKEEAEGSTAATMMTMMMTTKTPRIAPPVAGLMFPNFVNLKKASSILFPKGQKGRREESLMFYCWLPERPYSVRCWVRKRKRRPPRHKYLLRKSVWLFWESSGTLHRNRLHPGIIHAQSAIPRKKVVSQTMIYAFYPDQMKASQRSNLWTIITKGGPLAKAKARLHHSVIYWWENFKKMKTLL